MNRSMIAKASEAEASVRLPGVESSTDVLCKMKRYTTVMTERAEKLETFTSEEIDVLNQSLRNLDKHVDENAFGEFWSSVAHIPHMKDWQSTMKNVEKLSSLMKLNADLVGQEKWLHRVLEDGHWEAASSKEKPFVVLVTGLNGIRKSTALYQPWFADLLFEALGSGASNLSHDEMPTGRNSFFRQLDYMIATVCNQEFLTLYQFSNALEQQKTLEDKVIECYSDLKAAIFSRYRTVAELLGIVLLQVAQKESKNCILETSGRNKSMFEYIDRLFLGSSYQKLVLHFVVNDIKAAQKSVDQRMREEIIAGRLAKTPEKAIRVNQGGPYGSDVLEAVQSESDAIWEQVENGSIAADWLKATIQIDAHESAPWTARAVCPDGTRGKVYTYDAR